MRKLGTWGGLALAAALSVVGLGSSAGPAPAQGNDVPWLGVMTQSLNRGLREGLDYDGKGVLISQVMKDSPAERAGIRKGDIIVSVNSKTVDSPSTLTDLIRGSRVGRSVSIVLVRDGQRRTVTPRLTERPNDFETPEQGDRNDFHFEMGPLNEWHDGKGGATFVFPGMGRGRLGVRLSDLNEDLGSYFDVRDGQGALVLEVLKDTPAERAGLKAGDVLTKIGDRKVSGSDDVVEALQDAPEGKISITAVRKGASRTFEAELDEAPRALRIGPGRDLTVLRPRDRLLVTPDVRRKVERDTRGNDQEIQELRDQLRELQRKLDQLENDRD